MESKSAPSHEELQRYVFQCEPLLRNCWAQHKNADDVLILGDTRREECHRTAFDQYGQAALDRLTREAESHGLPPMVPYLQPVRFLDALAKSGFAGRECAKELRAFAALASFGFVPLLVVTPGGMWATQWVDPADPRAAVLRCEPETPVEAN